MQDSKILIHCLSQKWWRTDLFLFLGTSDTIIQKKKFVWQNNLKCILFTKKEKVKLWPPLTLKLKKKETLSARANSFGTVLVQVFQRPQTTTIFADNAIRSHLTSFKKYIFKCYCPMLHFDSHESWLVLRPSRGLCPSATIDSDLVSFCLIFPLNKWGVTYTLPKDTSNF